jgi:hypothetical protein
MWRICLRREFSGLPVYVGVEDGYVKRTAPMDQRQFRRYLETCRRLGFRFDKGSSRWRSYSHLQRYKPAPTPTRTTTGRTLAASAQPTRLLMDRLVEAVAKYPCRHRSVGLFRLTLDLTRRRLAEVGTVEVVRDSGHRGVAGRRQATHALRQRVLAQAGRRPSTGQVC